ncbi:MAG TPA: hydroxysqualene dehydroxylase HpnE [Terriglobia bacterium]|nr:hydroxysqualene dehydroxylase HpnE [Terriglobia bacterium]
MSEDIIIVGGGLAGLAAGVALSEAGRRVRLIEQKPYLGGRARSFRDAATGSVVDNGQHLFMGCYHSTIRFLNAIGTSGTVTFDPQLRVRFLDADGKPSELRCPAFPAPWHLLTGVCLSNSFTFGEKVDVLRMGRALRPARGAAETAGGLDHLTVEQWLSSLGQRESLRRNFWDLLCIAAMNEDPEIASALLFQHVLRLTLFSSPLDSRLGIPRQGLSDCYTEAASRAITGRGGSVELRRDARALLISNGACRGVKLADGTTIESRTVLSAVPWHVLPALLPEDAAASEFFSRILNLHPAPIISLYFWFDRPVTDLEFVGLRGTTIQWLFNKGKILGNGGNYVSLVLSGAHDHIARSKEDLQETALRELRSLLPEMQDAKLLHSLVIKERFATFSPCVGVDALRPAAVTPVRGLFLAGDWTDTSLPATIEGAVQSGYTAAEAILQSN